MCGGVATSSSIFFSFQCCKFQISFKWSGKFLISPIIIFFLKQGELSEPFDGFTDEDIMKVETTLAKFPDVSKIKISSPIVPKKVRLLFLMSSQGEISVIYCYLGDCMLG